jgi:hypothetical protein
MNSISASYNHCSIKHWDTVDPKSEIANWTQRCTRRSNLIFRISDLRCRNRPISNLFHDPPSPGLCGKFTFVLAFSRLNSLQRITLILFATVVLNWIGFAATGYSLIGSDLFTILWHHTGSAACAKTRLASAQSPPGDVFPDRCRTGCADGDLRLYWLLPRAGSNSELSVEVGARTP